MEHLSLVRAPSGAQRSRQLQAAKNALQDYTEQRKLLHTLHVALKRAAWLRAGRTSRMPYFPVAYHITRDEGRLHRS